MKNASIENKLKILQDRKSTITAKMQKLETSVKVTTRKQALQRKILVGAYYLEQAAKNGTLSELKEIMFKRSEERRVGKEC